MFKVHLVTLSKQLVLETTMVLPEKKREDNASAYTELKLSKLQGLAVALNMSSTLQFSHFSCTVINHVPSTRYREW